VRSLFEPLLPQPERGGGSLETNALKSHWPTVIMWIYIPVYRSSFANKWIGYQVQHVRDSSIRQVPLKNPHSFIRTSFQTFRWKWKAKYGNIFSENYMEWEDNVTGLNLCDECSRVRLHCNAQWDTKTSQATAVSNTCGRKPKTCHLHGAAALSLLASKTLYTRIWFGAFLWACLYSHPLIRMGRFCVQAM
jgi:hypothetical protein